MTNKNYFYTKFLEWGGLPRLRGGDSLDSFKRLVCTFGGKKVEKEFHKFCEELERMREYLHG